MINSNLNSRQVSFSKLTISRKLPADVAAQVRDELSGIRHQGLAINVALKPRSRQLPILPQIPGVNVTIVGENRGKPVSRNTSLGSLRTIVDELIITLMARD